MAGIAGMGVMAVVAVGAMMWSDDAAARSPERLSSVTVCSRYGKGCVSGPVRPGKFGPDVRMPGGTWISCKLDCRNTLREETVDFWETKERDKPFGNFGRRR
jgi:hypothetical protein